MDTPGKLFDFESGELLLIDKPLTWTSFDVVGKVRNTIRSKKLKVGHAGTLDPLATGLLIVCTGKLTKKVEDYLVEEKEYTGTITLGGVTPSFDKETEVTETFPTDHITEKDITETAVKFIGETEQFSPSYSARRIDGERSYKKARRGEEVKTKSRPVTISEFEITDIALPEVTFRIVCSKGTYIRSIANDFGAMLNNGGYLSSLRRTRSGSFLLKDAWKLDELITKIKEQRLNEDLSQS